VAKAPLHGGRKMPKKRTRGETKGLRKLPDVQGHQGGGRESEVQGSKKGTQSSKGDGGEYTKGGTLSKEKGELIDENKGEPFIIFWLEKGGTGVESPEGGALMLRNEP